MQVKYASHESKELTVTLNRPSFALAIGHFLIAINECEDVVDFITFKLDKQPLSETWMKKVLKKKGQHTARES
jgi:hypothetical protein